MSRIGHVTLAVAALAGVALTAVVIWWRTAGEAAPAGGSAAAGDRSVSRHALTDAEIRRCAECHPDACEEFAASPHFNTLRPAVGEELLARFTGPEGVGVTTDGKTPGLRYVREGDALYAEGGPPPGRWKVNWIVGSGRSGQTPVTVRDEPGAPAEALEYHASWFPGRGLELTLGHEPDLGPGFREIARPLTPDTTFTCLECHSTGLKFNPFSERLDLGGFQPGVRCDRCHEGARRHLESGGATAMARLSEVAPEVLVRQCGQCHRNVDDVEPEKIASHDPEVARFAPVGLSLSACFKRQGAKRFDCVTCHDPHRPPPADIESVALASCVTCHTASSNPCPDQPLTSNCLPCHMPRVTIERHMQVTDHWIRVRDDVSAEPGGHGESNAPAEPPDRQ